jgi:hypothetical protein
MIGVLQLINALAAKQVLTALLDLCVPCRLQKLLSCGMGQEL